MTAFFINSLANKHISERLRITEELLVDKLMKANEIDVQDLDFVDETGAEKFDLVTKLNAFDSYTKKPTYTHDVDGVETEIFIENAIENNTTQITNLSTDVHNNYVTNTALSTELTNYPTNSELTTALTNHPTNAELTTALTNYPTNSELTTALTNHPTNAELTTALTNHPTNTELSTALALKEDIANLKVMINMLALGVQPSRIELTTINKRAKFAKTIDDGDWKSFEFFETTYNSTETFLQHLYIALAKLWEASVHDNTDSYGNTANSGTNGDSTGGFYWKYILNTTTFPVDAGEYKLFFEDDYVCNKNGILSMSQILRTGNLTLTRVNDTTITLVAQFPNDTI